MDPARLGPADPGPFFHGTKADLTVGERLDPGNTSNFGSGKAANFVYLTASLAITFPFNITIGIPLYYEIAKRLYS